MKITLADCFLVLCVAQCTICAVSQYVIDSEVDSTIANFKSGSSTYAIFIVGEDGKSITTGEEGAATSWEAFVSDLANDDGRKTPCAYGIIRVTSKMFDKSESLVSANVYVTWIPETFRSLVNKFYCLSFSTKMEDYVVAHNVFLATKAHAGTPADLPREVASRFV